MLPSTPQFSMREISASVVTAQTITFKPSDCAFFIRDAGLEFDRVNTHVERSGERR